MSEKIQLKIGRSVKNDVVVHNEDVSLFHLELFGDASGNIFITDLNSEAGTFVNGKRLKGYTLLGSGDYVQLGASYELKWAKYKLSPALKEVSPVKKNKNEPSPSSNSDKNKPSKPKGGGIETKQLIVIYSLVLFFLILFVLLS
jgi:pSer/pThr/pTyr-binding forkhead associated (FHA) protein